MEAFAIQSEQLRAQPAAQSETAKQSVAQQSGQSRGQRSQDEPAEAGPQKVEQAVKDLAMRFELKVELAQDERTGRQVVKIFSRNGKRLIRQMPPEGALKLAAKVRLSKAEGLFNSVA